VCSVQVLVTDPKELEKIRERESDITKERIQKILASGANVVLTTKGIDDMALKYFVEAGVIACRRVPKEDMRYALVSIFQTIFIHAGVIASRTVPEEDVPCALISILLTLFVWTGVIACRRVPKEDTRHGSLAHPLSHVSALSAEPVVMCHMDHMGSRLTLRDRVGALTVVSMPMCVMWATCDLGRP
jgi:hypothetical protein